MNITAKVLGRTAILAGLAVWSSCFAASTTSLVFAAEGVTAVRANDFLNSIGTQSAISVRGESLEKTIECARHLGVRWLRAGIEGNVPLENYIELHRQTGVRFSWGLGSAGTDIAKLIATGRHIAEAGAVLAFEGPNEPNNWGIKYQGEAGGRNASWMAVAKLQHDLYQAVKSDPVLKQYPVWSITEGGAETDNVGLQFLTIPADAGTIMPAGTRYADYANVHNYIYHPNAAGLEDNKTWKAADPTAACKVDGLYGEYGLTWAHHFAGYGPAELLTLPRVTTETGALIGGDITEEVHALNLLTLYLDQFTRGWGYTAVYLLRDRVDEGGNQRFGFYKPDYSPRKAALYLHNLTTILRDTDSLTSLVKLAYSIPDEPATVHDLLLQNHNGALQLIVWDERLHGSDKVRIKLGRAWPSVRIFDPTTGTKPGQTLANVEEVALELSNHPIVLELRD